MLQEYVVGRQENKSTFTDAGFKSCQAQYSDYLLGEIRDEIDFYFANANFEDLIMFFSYLKGKSHFGYDRFKAQYSEFRKVISKKENVIEQLSAGPEVFLQFLYSLNIIGYKERTDSGDFVHWCFRDRTRIKLDPKVRFGVEYNIHPGLARALQVGRSKNGI